MSLERKDVRCKLDPEVHAAFKAISELDGKDVGELTETLIVEFVTRRIHDATVLADAVARLGIAGNIGAPPGKAARDA